MNLPPVSELSRRRPVAVGLCVVSIGGGALAFAKTAGAALPVHPQALSVYGDVGAGGTALPAEYARWADPPVPYSPVETVAVRREHASAPFRFIR